MGKAGGNSAIVPGMLREETFKITELWSHGSA